jgi:hypothetical protein
VRGQLAIAFAAVIACLFAAPAGAATQELTYRYGPIRVAPFEVNQNTVLNGVPKPQVDGFITHMEADVVDARGQKISPIHVMLHHVVFLNLGEPGKFDHHDWTCGTFTDLNGKTKVPALADRFYASGEERNVLQLPEGYGYKVSGKDSWVLLWMLMNHHPASQKVYIQYKITYETGRELLPAYMVWLDVRNCLSDPVFDVPGGGLPGSLFSQSATWTAPTAGRLVAGGGHLHGGGKSTVLSQPDCGDRELFTSRPTYGPPGSPVYLARPILHEPGPANMSGFLSQQGLPVAKGQRLKLTANYDNRYMHARVMGIMGVYFSPDPGVVNGCGPLPPMQVYGSPVAGRPDPPHFKIPLTRPPEGRWRRLGSRSTIHVSDFAFHPERIVVRRGTTLRWKFDDYMLHDVTVANGPRGFSSPYLSNGRVFRQKLKVPGTYRLFCTVHPLAMTQEIKVLGKRRR